MEPQIRYVRAHDGANLATATIGAGPALLMLGPTGLGSIETYFAIPDTRRAFELLAERFTFVTFDPRGQGLSERDDRDLSLDTRVDDVAAVVDGLGLPPVRLLGRGLTGPTAIAFTARHPECVYRLALWAAPARCRDMPLSARLRAIAPLIDVDWPLYCQCISLVNFGWSETARIMSEHLVNSITPETFQRNWAVSREADASDLLQHVTCPTLVVHPKEGAVGGSYNSRVSLAALRDVAARIPGAVFRSSETLSFYAFWGSNSRVDAELLIEFFSESAPSATPVTPSGTAIILFADIASSTSLTESIGDTALRNHARSLDDALREIITDNGGTPIDGKLLGDGVLATFPAASQAITAAVACDAACENTPLKLHLGIHAGDVIRESNNVFGGAVNIAARISALSAPGEILVSATVRDLARTSAGVTFEDLGQHELKGIADPVHLFAVRPGGEA